MFQNLRELLRFQETGVAAANNKRASDPCWNSSSQVMEDDRDNEVRQAHAPDRQSEKSPDTPTGKYQFRGFRPASDAHGHPYRKTSEAESDDGERAEEDEENAIHE